MRSRLSSGMLQKVTFLSLKQMASQFFDCQILFRLFKCVILFLTIKFVNQMVHDTTLKMNLILKAVTITIVVIKNRVTSRPRVNLRFHGSLMCSKLFDL